MSGVIAKAMPHAARATGSDARDREHHASRQNANLRCAVVPIREEKNGVFQNRWWTYGHIAPSSGINVGTNMTEGQQIGTVDEYDGFPHIHLSVHSTNWQAEIVDPTPPAQWAQHWGIARGVTQDLARAAATNHTVHPIHAYALYKGYDVTR